MFLRTRVIGAPVFLDLKAQSDTVVRCSVSTRRTAAYCVGTERIFLCFFVFTFHASGCPTKLIVDYYTL